MLAFAVIVSVLWLFLHFNRLSDAQRFILIFYVSALFIDINVYHFIDYYNPRYCVPLVPFGVLMVLMALETEPFVLPDSRRILAVVLTIGIVASSVATVREEARKPRHGAEAYTQMVEWLEKNHIYSGYAGAWNTNVLTELSNGKIEMWTLNWNLRQKGEEPILPWLQKTDHETRKPEGRVFLLFDRVEDGAIESSQYYLDPSKKEFENGYFNIYVYDSADELLESINSPKPEMEAADAESAGE